MAEDRRGFRRLASRGRGGWSGGKTIGVQLNIKDERTVQLARELAQQLGKPVTDTIPEALEEMAARACRDYGRGSEHRARLNFGDRFSYALAKATGEPLLFKGDDFLRTDIQPAA